MSKLMLITRTIVLIVSYQRNIISFFSSNYYEIEPSKILFPYSADFYIPQTMSHHH